VVGNCCRGNESPAPRRTVSRPTQA
jgi:hypothetical protein